MTAFNRSSRVAIATLILMQLALSGCSRDKHPKRYAVSGKVLFPDGEPVRTGVVELVPEEGNLTAHGDIKRDGTYSLSTIKFNDGAVPGNYRVVVKQFIFYDKIPEHKHDHGGDVSVKFADEKSTPLRLEVKKRKNTADFEVEYRVKK